MDQLVREPLFYIFFVYGVSFLFMSFMVFYGARTAAASPLVYSFYMLALFGLTHGITEIVDWLRFIVKTLGQPEIVALTWLSQIFLIVSFVFLLQFAVNALTHSMEKRKIIRAVPAVLLGLFVLFVLARGISDIRAIGLKARYGFGFTGAALSAVALFLLAHRMNPLGNSKLVNGLNLTGAAFACYALFGGLIIKPIAGIPIQLFRSACAVTAAFSSVQVLEIFKYVKSRQE
jgi:uncharacterized membrane protein